MNAPEQLSFAEFAPAPLVRAIRLRQGEAAGDLGIKRAAGHAERCAPGWMDAALKQVRAFARNQGGALFTIETLRWAIQTQIPAPPDLRAWGAVSRIAASRGYIAKTKRTAPTASSNGSDRPLYTRGPQA